ncbi:MAG: prepilin-type N-terminal cleavage/methylation domain-containing protein [Pirellulaceae bacterium]
MKAGFTLLELLVVLVIMALLTALVAVRLQGPYQSARLEDALQRVAFVDSQARAHAREFSTSCQIVFQLDRGRLYSQGPGSDSARHCEFSLPGSLRIERLLTSQMELGSGTGCIDISARGTAVTYALCLATSQGTHRWLLFAGLTGRVAYPKDEIHVQQLFELLQASGTDAH